MVAHDDHMRRKELAAFLIARRTALQPEDVGLRASARRRTPGLRREEVAELAGISTAWYTWLEQGRAVHASIDTVARIATALRMGATDTLYLQCLAGTDLPTRIPGGATFDIDLQPFLDGFTAGPAVLLDEARDVLGWNMLAQRVLLLKPETHPLRRNYFWRAFLDPIAHALYVNWDDIAGLTAAHLRLLQAQRPNTRVDEIVASLLLHSEDFRRHWTQRSTAGIEPVAVALKPPGAQTMHFTSLRLLVGSNETHLLLLLVPADDTSRKRLRRFVATAAPKAGATPAADPPA